MLTLSSNILKRGLGFIGRRARRVGLLSLAFLICLLVRLVRSIVLVRFGQLPTGRIGHFAANTDLYLCLRQKDKRTSPRTWDLFYPLKQVSNNQLMLMWKRVLFIHPFVQYLERANKLIPGSRRHIVELPSDRDLWGLNASMPPHLSFTPEEERLGLELMSEMGLSPADKFICFAARDSAYLNSFFPGHDWRYHDYRDTDITSFLAAAEAMAKRGYFLIRMGAVVQTNLKTENKKIIDYATKHRSEFMDVFLCSRCHFYLGDTAGLYALARIFRRPVAWTNLIPLELAPTWGKEDLFIPKLLWLTREKRFITFREILESGAGRFIKSQDYQAAGLEPVANTPEEIADLAREMDDRLRGVWSESEEDKELQRRFWALFKPSDLNGLFLCRIGAKFLQQHRNLLD